MIPENGRDFSIRLIEHAHKTEIGVEFWFARDLQIILGYTTWRIFYTIVTKAKTACESAGLSISDHFISVRKTLTLSDNIQREIDDIQLSRFACYMIALYGDPNKQEIAFAQTYFAIQPKNAINGQLNSFNRNILTPNYGSKSNTENDEISILKIFLCHASEDKKLVRIMHKQLKQDGFSPWLDEIDILPGQDWEHEITKAVKHTNVVLACLSIKSTTKAGFVQKEIKYALDKADEQPEGTIFVIPVKFEECDVPLRLSKWQWVNYFDDNGHEKLVTALKKRCTELDIVHPQNNSTNSGVTPLLQLIQTACLNNKLMSWSDFNWVSNSRRDLTAYINDYELAFALKCALQHGKNLPFWCKSNSNNSSAIESIISPIYENYGRRPLLRAGFAMEKLNNDLKKVAYDKSKDHAEKLREMGNDIPLKVINAALAGSTLELWKNELQSDSAYKDIIRQLIQEISESAS